jgi:hypothetical protein
LSLLQITLGVALQFDLYDPAYDLVAGRPALAVWLAPLAARPSFRRTEPSQPL